MKPNFFEIATDEVTQDGFIAWLLQWVNKDNEKHELYQCAVEFVKFLIREFLEMEKKIDEAKSLANLEIISVETDRQRENIDVWAKIDDKYLIIIEDKTFTSEHDNQLEEYKKYAKDWCKKEKKNRELICIYLKTGTDSNYFINEIINKKFKYKYINRSDLIKFFENKTYSGIKNDIYNDFFKKIKNLDLAEKAFDGKKIQEWDDNCWMGFGAYMDSCLTEIKDLKKQITRVIINWKDYSWNEQAKENIFLQIDSKKDFALCFKIKDELEKNINTQVAEDFRNKLRENKNEKIIIRKSSGKEFMTVAIVEKENWLKKEKGGTIDKEETIKELKKYEEILKKCIL